MGFRPGNLFRGPGVRDQSKDIAERKPIMKFKAFGRAASNFFGGHKKARQEEPICQDIDGTTSLSPIETSADNANNADDGHENVETADINRRTLLPDVPSLEVGNEEDISNDANTEPCNNGGLELLVATLEQELKDEKAQRREEVEALQVDHGKELEAANSKNVLLQKRFKKLMKQKSGRRSGRKLAKEVSLAAKKSSPDHHVEQSSSKNESQQDYDRLCKSYTSLILRSEESDATIQSTREHNHRLAGELAESQEQNKLTTRSLHKACQEAEYYRERMHQFSSVLEQGPGKYIDVDHEIELRDKRFSDLELRAAECFTEMAQVKKHREIAYAEVVELKNALAKQDDAMKWLEGSKLEFQLKSEEVLGMLSDRIVPSAFHNAIVEYYKLVVRDNSDLVQKINDQALTLSLYKDKTKQLRVNNHELEKQVLVNQETQARLEDQLRTRDDEIGRLEIELEGIIDEHRREIENQNSEIIDLRAENNNHVQDAEFLAQETDCSSVENMVVRKNREIADLKTELRNLWDEKCSLEDNEQAYNAREEFNAVANCYAERETEELKIRLMNADEELRVLRRRVYQ